MAKFVIESLLVKSIDGIMYTAKVRREVQIRLKDLDFGAGREEDGGRIVFTPARPEAASRLYDIFPPEECTYTYYTYRGDYPDDEDSRPWFWLEIRNKKDDLFEKIEFWFLTKEDYDYLRMLFLESIPDARIMTAEEYFKEALDRELLGDGPEESPVHGGLDRLISRLPEKDYLAVQKLFYARREEYMDKGLLEIDRRRFYGVMNDEIMQALLERAERKIGL